MFNQRQGFTLITLVVCLSFILSIPAVLVGCKDESQAKTVALMVGSASYGMCMSKPEAIPPVEAVCERFQALGDDKGLIVALLKAELAQHAGDIAKYPGVQKRMLAMLDIMATEAGLDLNLPEDQIDIDGIDLDRLKLVMSAVCSGAADAKLDLLL